MNIKATTKYQLGEFKKYLATYYLVILSTFVFFTMFFQVSGGVVSGANFGLEFITAIFLFNCGLNSFKVNFLMMMQNGISRKTMFIGSSITFLLVSLFMSIIDRGIAVITNFFTKTIGGLSFKGLYDVVFSYRIAKFNGLLFELEAILIVCAMYMAALIAGYFITTLYYRMNKALKIIVSVVVPVTLIIILPLADSMVFNGKIGNLVSKLFVFIFGESGSNPSPYNMLLVCVMVIIITMGLSWLLVKKAVDKN